MIISEDMKLLTIKRIFVAVLSSAFLAMSACDVTDQTPVTLVPEDEAFADAGKVMGNILGVYDAAQRGWYLGAIQRGYPFGAAHIQQGDMRSGDMYNDQLFYEITYINAWSPTTANQEGQWLATYRLINRINIVLEGLDEALGNGVIDQEEYDSYRAEMLFIRGLSHYDLVINFSRPYSDDPSMMGIPLRLFAVNDVALINEAEQVGRGTVAGTYEQILADLNEAEALGTEIWPFRASRSAAIAFKTRVKLHQQDWAGVIEEFNKLDFGLAPSPDQPFRDQTGMIFAFQNTPESNPGVNGALAAMYGNPQLGGRGLVKVSPLIWNEPFWLQGDLRRELLTTRGPDGIYTSKYDGYVNRDDPAPIIRYAEAVLNAAEAHARLGNLDQAVGLLNAVRNRSVPEGTPGYTAAGLGGQMGIIQGIINEKRIEFLAEGVYWYDIHRLSGMGEMNGIPPKVPSRGVNDISQYQPGVFGPEDLDHSLPYSDPQFVWPIPLQEIINNPLLAGQQNPGY
jgi:starch-binding outer membrane protein, SusD/RagB family